MKPKELIKLLKKQGWKIKRTKGSHYVLAKGSERVVVPYHNTDLKAGTLNRIMKDTGLKK